MPVRYFLQFLLILMLHGCIQVVSTSPEILPEPTSKQQIPPNQVLASRKSWVLAPTAMPRHYASIFTTSLELLTDSGVVHETSTTKRRFTFSLTPGSPFSFFTVIIEGISSETGTRIGIPADPAILPLSFTGQVAGYEFILRTIADRPVPGTPDCSNPAMTAISPILRTMVITPTTIVSGLTWSDSSSTSTCSGSVPVTLTAARHFQVIGEIVYDKAITILIERTEKLSFSGVGSQNQHSIAIAGNGVRSSKLYLDPATGYLNNTVGEQKTTFSVLSSGRYQQFTQVVHEATALSSR